MQLHTQHCSMSEQQAVTSTDKMAESLRQQGVASAKAHLIFEVCLRVLLDDLLPLGIDEDEVRRQGLLGSNCSSHYWVHMLRNPRHVGTSAARDAPTGAALAAGGATAGACCAAAKEPAATALAAA